jgi:DHA3 family macrolide efflux protein-like MFS transporter
MQTSKQPGGMTAFIIVWIGQIISILASGMSQFALTIWMYQQTKSPMAMSLMTVFYIAPFLLLSPFAGVMVDRYNRKLMMMVSDLTAVLATAAIFILAATHHLEFWHLYVTAILYGIGNTFQWPAYSAVISTLVPKEQLGRVNGLMTLMEAGPGVAAPILAGALLPVIGIANILAIDVATFFLAIGALVIVHIPQPRKTEEGQQKSGNVWSEAAYGFTYIFARPGLLGLQLIYFFGNLFFGISMTVMAPMILARTNNSVIFGSVQSAMAVGMVLGGLLMGIWGGLKRRVNGVLLGWIATSFVGMFLLGIGQNVVWWATVMAISGLIGPILDGSNQAIWQSKVAPDLQGRVFSARRLIAWFAQPIAPVIGGALAEYVLEPAMQTQSALAGLFGGVVGNVPGSGMSLLMIFCGLAGMLAGLSGYFIPAIRNVEKTLPDHDQLAPAEAPAV